VTLDRLTVYVSTSSLTATIRKCHQMNIQEHIFRTRRTTRRGLKVTSPQRMRLVSRAALWIEAQISGSARASPFSRVVARGSLRNANKEFNSVINSKSDLCCVSRLDGKNGAVNVEAVAGGHLRDLACLSVPHLADARDNRFLDLV
jgi:hypothetical protein